MTEYYIPAFTRAALPSGGELTLFRGIHHVPDDLANHADANGYGIKPLEEMTDAEWAALALDKDVWMKANRPSPETQSVVDPKPSPAPAPAPPITLAPAAVTVTPLPAKPA